MLRKIWLFYYEGFKSMTIGKTLWLIVAIKLFFMFFVLKLFFFRNDLAKFGDRQDKSRHVIENLTKK